jgi:hypothetical protein
MTDSFLHKKLREYYQQNLEKYIKEHPGEYILIEKDYEESFYKNKVQLGCAINKKYWSSKDYTIFGTQIPGANSEEKDILI